MRRTFRSNTAIPTGTVCSKAARRQRSSGRRRSSSWEYWLVNYGIEAGNQLWLCLCDCDCACGCACLSVSDSDHVSDSRLTLTVTCSRHCDCQSSVTESYSSLWLPRLSWDCVCLNRNRLRLRRDFPRLPANTSRYCVISLRAVLRCAVENLAMSFKLHIFTHDQDNVQIPSIVSIIVYNMYLEASEMCVWGVTTSLRTFIYLRVYIFSNFLGCSHNF